MSHFKKVYIEITNRCNLNCSFCPKSKRKTEFMTVGSFKMILDEIKPFTDYIYLHVKGEPLLHPDIDKILDASHEKGFQVNITTNGTLIQETQNKIILKPALRQINFSLHSFDEKPSDEGKDEYLNHIFSFAKEALANTNMYISFRLWNLQKEGLNTNGNKSIFDLLEKEFGLDYALEEKLTPGRGIKIKENLYLNSDYEFKWPDIKDTYENPSGFCYGLRDQVAILVDGTVVPCCLDGEGVTELGNIFSQNFGQIIASERAKNIYEGFSNRTAVEKLCCKCQYKERF
jgi:radical SAM protein with 4Fe4S-binding SPASM domain